MADEIEILRHEARVAHARVLELEKALADAKEARYEMMRKMHAAGFSWAEMGREFDCTPQAVMYGSGLVQRSRKN